MVAVLSLGEAVGYSCVLASIRVGLWSIFYYHEIKDTRHILLWFRLCIGGIILLSIMQQT